VLRKLLPSLSDAPARLRRALLVALCACCLAPSAASAAGDLAGLQGDLSHQLALAGPADELGELRTPCWRRRHCQRGQQVPVRYNVANPRTVEIDTFSGRGNVQLLIGLISAVAIIVLVVS